MMLIAALALALTTSPQPTYHSVLEAGWDRAISTNVPLTYHSVLKAGWLKAVDDSPWPPCNQAPPWTKACPQEYCIDPGDLADCEDSFESACAGASNSLFSNVVNCSNTYPVSSSAWLTCVEYWEDVYDAEMLVAVSGFLACIADADCVPCP